MSGADFLDSNVFIYLFDRQDARKRAIAEKLVNGASAEGVGVISHQVVQETLNVLTGQLKPALNALQAGRVLRDILLPLWKIMPDAALYARALELMQSHGFGFYDSLIVAAALNGGCKRLLSEDLRHGQRIGTLTVHNPFVVRAG
jgi:predicted nucleic acid-binding protein